MKWARNRWRTGGQNDVSHTTFAGFVATGRKAACGMLLAVFATSASAPGDTPRKPAAQPRLPPLPPAVIDNTLAVGGADIAARKVSTRMTVAAHIDGHGPFRFVVDSGADSSALSLRTAQSLRLAAGTPVMLHGMTASSIVDRVMVAELGLGQSLIRDLELPVLNEQDLGAAGLLGIDALVEQRLMMDFEKRVITVEDARRPAPRLDGEIVVIARRRRGQLILTQASVAGRPVDAVIDTGSEITVGNSALKNQLARRNKLQDIEVTGVTGVTIKMPILRLAEVRVGPVMIRNVPIAFFDVPPFTVFGLDDQPAILLGTDLMENFRRISLDFRHRKVRFQLKRCASTSVTVRTTGFASRLSAMDRSNEICRS
jgi:predicted aspartyl protease